MIEVNYDHTLLPLPVGRPTNRYQTALEACKIYGIVDVIEEWATVIVVPRFIGAKSFVQPTGQYESF